MSELLKVQEDLQLNLNEATKTYYTCFPCLEDGSGIIGEDLSPVCDMLRNDPTPLSKVMFELWRCGGDERIFELSLFLEPDCVLSKLEEWDQMPMMCRDLLYAYVPWRTVQAFVEDTTRTVIQAVMTCDGYYRTALPPYMRRRVNDRVNEILNDAMRLCS